MKLESINVQEWKDILSLAHKEEEVPRGYVASEDLRKLWELNERPFYVRIKSLLSNGIIERIYVRKIGHKGCLVRKPYYKIVKGSHVKEKVQDHRKKART